MEEEVGRALGNTGRKLGPDRYLEIPQLSRCVCVCVCVWFP